MLLHARILPVRQNSIHNGFQYTYSAREQAELKRIRDKYTAATKVKDKMARLCRFRGADE
jgi:hypothetical protein